VDNTNPSADARSEYIALAKSHKIPCRCFVLNTPIELCHHLNYVRVHQTSGEVRRIPGILKRKIKKQRFDIYIILDVGYNMYKKNYQAPKQSDGFDEIIQIEFTPKFDSEKDEKMFHYYTES
jgi:bifunctional polynucleotide phosphatase/kinase